MKSMAVSDPVTAYARAVLDGSILAGRLVRLACERHLRDLETGAARGLRFDPALAQRVFDFFSFLVLSEGQYAGKPFLLEPWQQFVIGSLFGWLGPDGFRRYRKGYVEIGKGNGKSPMAAAIGLYALVADGEHGAEVYAAATTADQARISFTDAKRMARASEALGKRLEVLEHSIIYAGTDSVFRPVSSEGRSLDGKRVHMAIIDELHEHPSNIVTEKMQAGSKARRQPLIFEITNSGYDRNSVCFDHHDYSAKVIEGIIPDDGWFAYVAQLDPCEACRHAGKVSPSNGCPDCDDWRDESTWLKANPNLDVSVPRKYLAEQVREATGMPSKQNLVKRLNFCIWTEQATRWLDMSTWDVSGASFDPATLKSGYCYGGIDLSSTTDLSALALVFPRGDEVYVLMRFWMPEDNVRERVVRDRVPYDVWIEQGWIETTRGNVVDYDLIRKRVIELRQDYDIREVLIDRWNSTGLQTALDAEGFEVVPMGQGFSSMTAPSKELEKLLRAGVLRHGNNPVLRWCASNVTAELDAAGNIKPSKAKSTERIDGIVALINALNGKLRHEGQDRSVYEERGLLIL